MQLKITLILIVVFSNLVQCQELSKQNIVALNLLTFFSPYHRNIDISYTRIINRRLHLETGISPIIPGGYWTIDKVGRENDKGLILKIEPKFNLFVKEQKFNVFINTKFYRTIHNYTSIRYETDNSENLVKYNVVSRVWGITPHIGFGISPEENVYLEFSIGWGKRRLRIQNDYLGEINDLSNKNRQDEKTEPENNGTHVIDSPSLNFKVGIRF